MRAAGLEFRQALAVFRLQLGRTFFSRRGLWVYLLVLTPMVITAGHWLTGHRSRCSLGDDTMIYAGLFQFYYLRLGIFFGCLGIFSNLIRGDVLEKTLHYYFLSPVRRELLVIGKYLAGLVAATVLFAGSAGASYLMVGAHFGSRWHDFLYAGQGLHHMLGYMTSATLACFGYGSVFLLAGLRFRNPMIPAAVVWVWEAGNGILPEVLQKISVIEYVKSLAPMQPKVRGPLALLAVTPDPPPAWLAVTGVLLVSLALLAVAAWQARTMEVSYTD